MKKSDVFKAILTGLSLVNPAAGAAVSGVASGVGKLIHRDDDPSNDLDETADALTGIIMNVVLGAESLTAQDYVNEPVLAQLAANIRGDIRLAQLVVNRKPAS